MQYNQNILHKLIFFNLFYLLFINLYATHNLNNRISSKYIYNISKNIKYNLNNIIKKKILYENKQIFKYKILLIKDNKKNYNNFKKNFFYVSHQEDNHLKLTIDFANNKGKLPWPVKNGIILNHFGIQNYPGLEGIYIDNSGIDILVINHNEAKAIFQGVVIYIYSIYRSMKAVLIQHGNYYTLYSNLKDILVQQGNKVKINQYIGKIYTSPKGETLLNFQVWHNTSKENPSDWIKNL